MNSKMLQGIGIASLSILAVVFLFMGYMDIAVLFMTVLFVLTNTFRYRQMKAQGMDREAKWMMGMAVIFGILFFVVLGTILF
ncbi:hypothetical protein [Planomicrobium okeanokoites]|uniref:Uncharacterized protein n=1 Tax=Planomicrobium okeanokoites TaxID=244 RepID=A0ABV7KI65_PLAOK|nr:hypothetical protein [Planomicrobium okeanokoites]TAA68769.1 hypothetical protein D2910_10025 [Planomicrobium okeanokoites]